VGFDDVDVLGEDHQGKGPAFVTDDRLFPLRKVTKRNQRFGLMIRFKMEILNFRNV